MARARLEYYVPSGRPAPGVPSAPVAGGLQSGGVQVLSPDGSLTTTPAGSFGVTVPGYVWVCDEMGCRWRIKQVAGVGSIPGKAPTSTSNGGGGNTNLYCVTNQKTGVTNCWGGGVSGSFE